MKGIGDNQIQRHQAEPRGSCRHRDSHHHRTPLWGGFIWPWTGLSWPFPPATQRSLAASTCLPLTDVWFKNSPLEKYNSSRETAYKHWHLGWNEKAHREMLCAKAPFTHRALGRLSLSSLRHLREAGKTKEAGTLQGTLWLISSDIREEIIWCYAKGTD